MYPIKFENIYYDKIWGGRDFAQFRNNIPEGMIGESWDVACHKNGMSIVENGEFAGMRFDDLIKSRGKDLLGVAISEERFPLLVKLINANDKLSVQVHPDDEYGLKVENDLGKTEAWYVVDAFEGANLVVGTNGCTKEEFAVAINNGTCEELLNRIPVKKGDVFFVTTYRVFDYNRGREIHVEKAMDCIDFSLIGKISSGVKLSNAGYDRTILNVCNYFSLEKYDVRKSCTEKSDLERFYIFTCVDGNGCIKTATSSVSIVKGDSIFIPATLGEYTIEGNLELLKSYVPDKEKIKDEIMKNIII